MSDLAQARAAKARLREVLRDDDNVVGIGLRRTAAGYGVKVNVSSERTRSPIPQRVEGVEVQVDVVGPITAQT